MHSLDPTVDITFRVQFGNKAYHSAHSAFIMPLEIHTRRIHGDNPHAKPGFNRCGMSILRLQGEKVFAAQAFLVRLLGICKTSVSTEEHQMRKTHECSAVFLIIQKELRSGPTMLQDGYRHSFRIQFPDNPTAKHRFPDLEIFNG